MILEEIVVQTKRRLPEHIPGHFRKSDAPYGRGDKDEEANRFYNHLKKPTFYYRRI